MYLFMNIIFNYGIGERFKNKSNSFKHQKDQGIQELHAGLSGRKAPDIAKCVQQN